MKKSEIQMFGNARTILRKINQLKMNKVELFFKVCRGQGRRSDSFDETLISTSKID